MPKEILATIVRGSRFRRQVVVLLNLLIHPEAQWNGPYRRPTLVTRLAFVTANTGWCHLEKGYPNFRYVVSVWK